jgi:hypothetical protein
MKICFFSNDSRIKDLSERMEGVEISIFNSLSNMKAYAESSLNDKILLFVDLDEGDVAHDINREFLNQDKVIRILITGKVPFKTLKKHQGGKESAFGYIKKPLTPKLVSDLLNDFELADYVALNDLTHEGDKINQANLDLTFVGITKPKLDNIEVEAEEVTKGHVNEFRVPGPTDDEPIDSSDFSDVEFDLDDEPFEVESVAKGTEEIQMSNDEETILSKIGAIGNATASQYKSLANDKIQEKFDKVFKTEAVLSHGPTNSDLPPEQQNDFQIEEEQSLDNISINLDDSEDTNSNVSIPEDDLHSPETNTQSFVISMDDIDLENEITKSELNTTKVIIEEAIISNPEHDGSPASSLISKDVKVSELVSMLDEDEMNNSTTLDIEEVSLVDFKASDAEDDILSIDGAKIIKIEEKPAEGGLEIGQIEDGYKYTGGDPANADNWKEVK